MINSISSSKYHALIIGINDYKNYAFPDLANPVNDATRLSKVLNEKYNFEQECITLLINPNREQIIEKLDSLERRLAKNDNLLIFYAGHGIWDRNSQRGYWLPSDAEASSTANYIRNSTISGYVCSMKTKHTLLISDACFSGGIFRSRAGMPAYSSDYKTKLYKYPSRKAMTSGTLEEVPDESVFLKYLLKRLIENHDKYISAEDLFQSLKQAVLNNSDNIPQYGVVKNAGDEGGGFHLH